jgi:hypothetical protein
MRDIFVLKFFHRNYRSCAKSHSRMVKTISWRCQDPTRLQTLGLHTSTSCFSINAVLSHKFERLLYYCYSLFLFCFLYIWVRPPCLFILRKSYWRFGFI